MFAWEFHIGQLWFLLPILVILGGIAGLVFCSKKEKESEKLGGLNEQSK